MLYENYHVSAYIITGHFTLGGVLDINVYSAYQVMLAQILELSANFALRKVSVNYQKFSTMNCLRLKKICYATTCLALYLQ